MERDERTATTRTARSDRVASRERLNGLAVISRASLQFLMESERQGLGMYEFQGMVKKVGDLQKFASGFEKQDLVVQEDKDGSWPNVVSFTFKKNAVSKLIGVQPGTHVKVGFVVDGREWTDPKTGKARYFSDLTALKLELVGQSEQIPEPPDSFVGSPSGSDEEIPF